MKSMKLTKTEAKESGEITDSKEEYSYGLKLNLDSDSLDKLDMEKMPEVGTVMMLTARVEVTDIHVSERKDGDPHKSVGLQITDMELGTTKDKKNPGEALYGVPKDKTKEGKAIYVEGI